MGKLKLQISRKPEYICNVYFAPDMESNVLSTWKCLKKGYTIHTEINSNFQRYRSSKKSQDGDESHVPTHPKSYRSVYIEWQILNREYMAFQAWLSKFQCPQAPIKKKDCA